MKQIDREMIVHHVDGLKSALEGMHHYQEDILTLPKDEHPTVLNAYINGAAYYSEMANEHIRQIKLILTDDILFDDYEIPAECAECLSALR
jgi:hypothetical protein